MTFLQGRGYFEDSQTLRVETKKGQLHKPTVAIVGSTEPTEEGIRVALELTTLLVQADYTIASGLAQGVGTTAHLTALINERPTCAVLGNDLMSIYNNIIIISSVIL